MSGLITPDGGRVDTTPHLAAVASAMARPGQPAATYAALEAAMEAVLGHRLFTILRYHADSGESERVWTNRPAAYSVAGRKALNATFWSRQVLQERRAYLGRTAAGLRRPRRRCGVTRKHLLAGAPGVDRWGPCTTVPSLDVA